MRNPFTIHPRETRAGQGYWAHGWFAFRHSLLLIWAGLAGVVHAVFPWWAPFYTANTVIRVFEKLRRSGRHDDAIAEIVGPEWVETPYAEAAE